MTDNKAPSYPWYPRDFAADEPVQLMTLAEEGAYRRLLDHQWLHGSIPGDVEALACICKNTPVKEMRKIWARVEPCFVRMEGQPPRYINRKLERVRQERKAFIDKQSESGKRGAEARWRQKQSDGDPNGEPIATPMANECLAVAIASASAKDSSETSSPGEPAWNRGSVMGLVVQRLYLGKRPPEGVIATNASILTALNRSGHSWDYLARVVEGLARRRDSGELRSVGRDQPVSLKWINDRDNPINQLAVSEDAFYRSEPEAPRKRTGVTDIQSIVGRIG